MWITKSGQSRPPLATSDWDELLSEKDRSSHPNGNPTAKSAQLLLMTDADLDVVASALRCIRDDLMKFVKEDES